MMALGHWASAKTPNTRPVSYLPMEGSGMEKLWSISGWEGKEGGGMGGTKGEGEE